MQCRYFTTRHGLHTVTARGADLSRCGTYRWSLARGWSNPHNRGGGGTVAWLMLNPSTADAYQDDPTIVRCMKFSASWGYSGITVVNLFPFRSSSPAACRKWLEPFLKDYGDDRWYIRDALAQNATKVRQVASEALLHVVACGTNVIDEITYGQMLEEFQGNCCLDLYCLGLSSGGYPLHPMARGRARIPDDREPKRFHRS
jgi:hypothetical protein